MATFTIYPRKGDVFTIECERFVFDAEHNEFELYDEYGQVKGLLPAPHVAAIVQTELRPTQRVDMLTFTVQLRGHLDKPFQVNGTNYNRGPQYDFTLDGRPLRNFYVDPQEIVVITSSKQLLEGKLKWDTRIVKTIVVGESFRYDESTVRDSHVNCKGTHRRNRQTPA